MVYDLDFQGNIDNRLRIQEEYTNDFSTPLPPLINDIIQSLIEETERDFEQSQFMTTETQRQFLYKLVKLFGSSCVLEIGTFTGVATITMASALLSHSITANEDKKANKVVLLEVDSKAIDVARKYIQKLKDLEDRVEFILGPAIESLIRITKERPDEQHDFIFIVLFYGQVHRQAGYADMKPINFKRDIPGMAKQIHQFNEHVLKDQRIQVVMLPLFDGASIITTN
ncbi:S-adenosyl-L-methionine-dependent methyltransferase [Phascolomyces articulosus]|uniref:S-adenosyl-L-methionine-dependent methyltransferase n=1 Tax=Phascolomyces articulosus TaxID=60185 RepID=A0AAD5K1P8_9FUNG|nr:S-adenosyl-L-methionine-dependent methyltransferase [Phascolomyces articulosus]